MGAQADIPSLQCFGGFTGIMPVESDVYIYHIPVDSGTYNLIGRNVVNLTVL